jgi:hypothetical protein
MSEKFCEKNRYPQCFLVSFLYVNVELEVGKPTSLAMLDVITLTLGLRPRQGLVRMRAKRETQESHLMLLGVQKSVRE